MKLFCLSLSFFLYQFCFSQSDAALFIEKNNNNFYTEISKHQIFPKEFFNSQYILLGETHGFAPSQEVDLALFKLLNSRYNYKHYIAEVDDAKAWLLNEFLATGNEHLLKTVFSSWEKENAQWANKEHYDKYKALHAYQKTLTADQKIIIIGIDLPQDLSISESYFLKLTSTLSPDSYTTELTALRHSFTQKNSTQLAIEAKKLLTIFSTNSPKAVQQLGNNYLPLTILLNNLALLNSERDEAMFANFNRYIKTYSLETAKMYGFLGVFHCLQVSYNKKATFASLLKKSTSGSIKSITSFYTDGFIMTPYIEPFKRMLPQEAAEELWKNFPTFARSKTYIPLPYSNNQNNPVLERVEEIEILEKYTPPSSVHLFKIEGANSPFNKSKTYAEIKGEMGLFLTNQHHSTSEAFQYILLFKNPLPATPTQ